MRHLNVVPKSTLSDTGSIRVNIKKGLMVTSHICEAFGKIRELCGKTPEAILHFVNIHKNTEEIVFLFGKTQNHPDHPDHSYVDIPVTSIRYIDSNDRTISVEGCRFTIESISTILTSMTINAFFKKLDELVDYHDPDDSDDSDDELQGFYHE
jgi:hypothetical protein